MDMLGFLALLALVLAGAGYWIGTTQSGKGVTDALFGMLACYGISILLVIIILFMLASQFIINLIF